MNAWRLPDGGVAYVHKGGSLCLTAKEAGPFASGAGWSEGDGIEQLYRTGRWKAVRAYGLRGEPDPCDRSFRKRVERNALAGSCRKGDYMVGTGRFGRPRGVGVLGGANGQKDSFESGGG